MQLRRLISLTTLTLTLTSNAALSAITYAGDELTTKAAGLFRQDKLQDAVDMQQQAVKDNPNDWLSHAALSFYYWQQGNVVSAVEEGKIAVEIAPAQKTALMNLAAIDEGLDDCSSAIPLYEAASKADPHDWRPLLGLARCYLKSGQESKERDVLQNMLSQTIDDFDWYQELGDIYLRLDKTALAVEATKKATPLARTTVQTENNSCQLLLALVRDNQLPEAEKLAPVVFDSLKPNNYELYVRSAATLLSPSQSAEGAKILKAGEKNLTSSDDAEGFFRLGRVFEQKAATARTKNRAAWLENAAAAYRRALAVNQQNTTEQAKYHTSLVGVLEQQDDRTGMLNELTAAQSLDQFSQIVPFLRRKLLAQTHTSKARTNIALTRVDFKIKGLNCDCQISRAVESLGKVDGVAFAHIVPASKPNEGTLLFDPNTVSIATVFSQARESFRELYAKMKTPIDVQFESVSEKPINTVQDAIGVAQACDHGDVLKFFTTFKPVTPVMPVNALTARSGTTN